MSRSYMLDRWCVRCGRKEPTPYVRDRWQDLYTGGIPDKRYLTVDIGCGNGRNAQYLRNYGMGVEGVDMCPSIPWIKKCVLGVEALPFETGSVDALLANYIFMFLDPSKELPGLFREIRRVSKPHARMMVEFYPAKDSFTPDKVSMGILRASVLDVFGDPIHLTKDRMIINVHKRNDN